MNASPESTTGGDSPVTRAEKLILELRKQRDRNERAAWAIHHEEQSAQTIEDLLKYLDGFQRGSATEQRNLLRLVSSLLQAIAPLFEQRSQSPFGRPNDFQSWLEGTAPRLRRAFIDASKYLNDGSLPP